MADSFDPLKLLPQWGPKTSIHIDSDHIDACMAYYFRHNLETICIDPHREYRAKDISFLKKYPNIRGLSIWAHNLDVEPLTGLKELTTLFLMDCAQVVDLSRLTNLTKLCVECTQPIDVSVLPRLVELYADWNKKTVFHKYSKTLKKLHLARFNPASKSLTDLPSYLAIEELEIVNSPVTSLAGLRQFTKLLHAEFHYLRKLISLVDLEAETLEHLHFGTCRNVVDHESVARLRHLRILRMNKCGTIKTLAFLAQLPRLEEFRFVGSDVGDGDMAPLLRLKRTSFSPKKHFSHTLKEIKEAIGDTTP